MTDIPELIEVINEMDADADTIENEMSHLFSSLAIVEKPNLSEKNDESIQKILFRPSLPTYVPTRDKWEEPNKELSEYHRYIIKHYEKWYNQALFLIREYNKSSEVEFIELHNGKRESYTGPDTYRDSPVPVTKMITVYYGISELLQFNEKIKGTYEPQKLIKTTTNLFSKQRASLLALPDIVKMSKKSNSVIPNSMPNKKEVFIVHGHDEELKQSVARFIEKIDLKPIILHEQPNQNRHLLQKLKDYSDVGYAIVLLTRTIWEYLNRILMKKILF